MRSRSILALLACALVPAGYAGNALATSSPRAAPPPAPTTTILAKSVFDELHVNAHSIPARLWRARIRTEGSSDVYVVDNTFAPGATTGWHSHPGPSLILVVAGTVTNHTDDDASCAGHAYSAGSGFVDTGGKDVHMLRNESSAPAETIAVQLLPKDAVRKIDAPDPGNCR